MGLARRRRSISFVSGLLLCVHVSHPGVMEGGNIIPNAGDVIINGVSVVRHPTSARIALGVCPQFTAIDSQLTVREHLVIYGRLKGLRRGDEVNHNVESLMRATALHVYADRLASKLSGGNQRKLALAIALIGRICVSLF